MPVDAPEPLVWVVRHGETEWSRAGRHTSRTDLELTERGEQEAFALRAALDGVRFDRVLCSPLRRAQRTAQLAGLEPYTVDPDLREWDYGAMEGRTTVEIREDLPGWSIWDGPWADGETAEDVAARADRLLAGIIARGGSNVALVGHGHFSRVTAARWVGAPVPVGRWLDLDTATTSQLGWDRHQPVLRRWNSPAPPIAGE
jgi:broad specificity phosphatase PhoE